MLNSHKYTHTHSQLTATVLLLLTTPTSTSTLPPCLCYTLSNNTRACLFAETTSPSREINSIFRRLYSACNKRARAPAIQYGTHPTPSDATPCIMTYVSRNILLIKPVSLCTPYSCSVFISQNCVDLATKIQNSTCQLRL